MSLVTLLGLPLGLVWSLLAPAERGLITGDPTLGEGGFVALPGESGHRFDALAVFVLLGLGLGVLVGVAGWLLRHVRGPVLLLGLIAGSALAAWLAMRAGTTIAAARYNDEFAAAAVDTVAARPPPLESAWALVALPLATALVYGLAAGWNGRDDLGRRSR